MGCGTSSLDKGERDVLGVISRFSCNTVPTLQPHNSLPQLVVGRITSLTKTLTSPYSCQECVLYRTDCYVRKNVNEVIDSDIWEKVHTEVRAVGFEVRDPEDTSRTVEVPGKLLSVKYFSADDEKEKDFVQLSERTPSISALLRRCGVEGQELRDVRLREWCVEENTLVGVFGIVPSSEGRVDEGQLRMKPVLC